MVSGDVLRVKLSRWRVAHPLRSLQGVGIPE